MALSKSQKTKGQVILLCQMCEELDKQIQWKCLTCVCLMCNKCRKIHEKFKSSEEHKIVNLKDIALHEEDQSPDFDSIKCQIHAGQKCCLYCTVCEEVVCPVCIAEIHNTHKMVQVKEGFDIAMETIRIIHSSVDRDVVMSASNITILESMKADSKACCEKEKQSILNHEKYFIDVVQKHSKKLLQDLDERQQDYEKAVDKDESLAKQTHQDLRQMKEQLDHAVQSINATNVFTAAMKRETPTIYPINNTQYNSRLKFIPANLEHLKLESIYGKLAEIETERSQKMSWEVKASYRSGLPSVSFVHCSSNESFWVISSAAGELQNLLRKNKNTFEILQNLKLEKISAITSSANGELLLSLQKSNLYILDPQTKKITKSKYNVGPLITNRALHASKNGKIILGARESGNLFPVNGPRQVIVMDMNGKHETIYHLNNNKKPIFSCPIAITCDKNNRIYVIDYLSEDHRGKLLKLSQYGGIDKVYQGQPNQTFKPIDLVCTQSDYIIIANKDDHELHILNTEVQCIHMVNTEAQGIFWPKSLDFDNEAGLLYVGCYDGINCSNTEIHVVKFNHLSIT